MCLHVGDVNCEHTPTHSCPYQEDVNNDPDPEYCCCCEECTRECAADI